MYYLSASYVICTGNLSVASELPFWNCHECSIKAWNSWDGYSQHNWPESDFAFPFEHFVNKSYSGLLVVVCHSSNQLIKRWFFSVFLSAGKFRLNLKVNEILVCLCFLGRVNFCLMFWLWRNSTATRHQSLIWLSLHKGSVLLWDNLQNGTFWKKTSAQIEIKQKWWFWLLESNTVVDAFLQDAGKDLFRSFLERVNFFWWGL